MHLAETRRQTEQCEGLIARQGWRWGMDAQVCPDGGCWHRGSCRWFTRSRVSGGVGYTSITGFFVLGSELEARMKIREVVRY